MTNPQRRITEPSLPEHELIRAAGELPQLSRGFRDETLALCHGHVVRTRRARRARQTGIALAVCGLLLAVSVSVLTMQSQQSASVVQDQLSPGHNESPPVGSPGSGSVLSVGSPGDPNFIPTESQRLDRIIEDAERRSQRLIDAGMIPGL